MFTIDKNRVSDETIGDGNDLIVVILLLGDVLFDQLSPLEMGRGD